MVNDNKDNKANKESKTAETENQELANIALDEAEVEAKAIVDEATKEAESIKAEAEATKEKAVKVKGKYIVVSHIKENGKLFEPKTAYDGKNIKRFLEIGVIKLNK